MDFDDLMLHPLALFRQHPEVLDRWRSRFDFLLVDEFQDTNQAQYELIKFLGLGHGNVFGVGDDDQSSMAGAAPTCATCATCNVTSATPSRQARRELPVDPADSQSAATTSRGQDHHVTSVSPGGSPVDRGSAVRRWLAWR